MRSQAAGLAVLLSGAAATIYAIGLMGMPAASAQSPCGNGVTVPNGANAGLIADCEVLLGVRDNLRGTGALDWSASRTISSWEGIVLDGTPRRVTGVELPHKGLSGVIPTGLADLPYLRDLHLYDNELGGTIPGELGRLAWLWTLALGDNQLTGEVPEELGGLSNLAWLSLSNNQLTGALPASLGNLGQLSSLQLDGNAFSGDLPRELASLEELGSLNLGGNAFTGPLHLHMGEADIDQPQQVGLDHLETSAWPVARLFTGQAGQGALIWALDGEDREAFVVFAGILAFRPAFADFEVAGGKVFRVRVTATRSAGVTADATTFHITLTNGDEPGTIKLVDHHPTPGTVVYAFLSDPDGDVRSREVEWQWSRSKDMVSWSDLPTAGTSYYQPSDGDVGYYLRVFARYSDGQGPNKSASAVAMRRVTESVPPPGPPCNKGGFLPRIPDPGLPGAPPTFTVYRRLVADCNLLLGIRGDLGYPSSLNWSANEDITNWTGISTSFVACAGSQDQNCSQHEHAARVEISGIELHGLKAGSPLPPAFGQLLSRGLISLDLSNNDFTGPVPEILTDMVDLKALVLDMNHLAGPVPPGLARLPNLETLRLSRNNFSGPIPGGIGSSSSLRVLDLSHNHLEGPIPGEVANLSSLRTLDLSHNQLSGVLPAELSQFLALESINLSHNRLTGVVPAVLGRLPVLTVLDLGQNQLSGPIPAQLGSTSSKLIQLDLSGNRLSGSLPLSLGELRELQVLQLARNHLSGEVPSEIGRLGNLVVLTFDKNNLSGPLPPEIGQLYALSTLSLSENRLSGQIPVQLGQLVNLERLDLARNALTGPIPPLLGNLAGLESLHLNDNRLDGSIPPELMGLTNMSTLDLGRNQLTGPLPSEAGNWTSLRVLRLEGNNLSGELPVQLQRVTGLQTLALDDNGFSGELPPELGALTSLTHFSIRNNKFTGGIPESFQSMSELTTFEINGNQFTPPIFIPMGAAGVPQEVILDYPEGSEKNIVKMRSSEVDPTAAIWSLSGLQATTFSIDDGDLSFVDEVDYEHLRAVFGITNYEVTVAVTDGLTHDSVSFQVQIQNVDEPGSISVRSDGARQHWPIQAVLVDDDGRVVNASWQWERSEAETEGAETEGAQTEEEREWSPIEGALSYIYTPTADDVDRRLRVTAYYEDPQGPGKTATRVVAEAVLPGNGPPAFAGGQRPIRRIWEDALQGSLVGERIGAYDPDNDHLEYRLDSAVFRGQGLFSIDRKTGQLGVKQALDHETVEWTKLRVYVRDGLDAEGYLNDEWDAAIVVEIHIEDVNEPPHITGRTIVVYPEEQYSTMTYIVKDPEGDDVSLHLSGPDSAWFAVREIFEGNAMDSRAIFQVSFERSPDYEEPRDLGRMNLYNVTLAAVEATPEGLQSTLAVMVDVTDVYEPVHFRDPVSLEAVVRIDTAVDLASSEVRPPGQVLVDSVNVLLQFVMGIVGLLTVLSFMLTGVKYMGESSDGGSRGGGARDALSAGIVGLAVVLLARLLAYIINLHLVAVYEM